MTDVVLGHFWWMQTLCTSLSCCRHLIYMFFFWRDGAVVEEGIQPLLPSPCARGSKSAFLSWPSPSLFSFLAANPAGQWICGCCHVSLSPLLHRQCMSLPSRHQVKHAASPLWGAATCSACLLCASTLALAECWWRSHNNHPHIPVAGMWSLCHSGECCCVPQMAGSHATISACHWVEHGAGDPCRHAFGEDGKKDFTANYFSENQLLP